MDFFQCLGVEVWFVSFITRERGSRCSRVEWRGLRGEKEEREAVLPGEIVDTSSESANTNG